MELNDYWIAVVVLAFIALDVISGIIKAVSTGTLKSSEMRKGLLRKAAILLVLIAAFVLQRAVGVLDFPSAFQVLYPAVGLFIVVMEVGSLLENAGDVVPELKDKKLWALFGKDDEGEKHA